MRINSTQRNNYNPNFEGLRVPGHGTKDYWDVTGIIWRAMDDVKNLVPKERVDNLLDHDSAIFNLALNGKSLSATNLSNNETKEFALKETNGYLSIENPKAFFEALA